MFEFLSSKGKGKKQAKAEASSSEEAARFQLAARANMLARTSLAFARFDSQTAESFAAHFKTPEALAALPDAARSDPLAFTWRVMAAIVEDEIVHLHPDAHERLIRDLTETLPQLAAEDPAMRASLFAGPERSQAIFDTLKRLDAAGVEMTSQIVYDFITITRELLDPPEGETAIVEGRAPEADTLRNGLERVFDRIEQQTGETGVRAIYAVQAPLGTKAAEK